MSSRLGKTTWAAVVLPAPFGPPRMTTSATCLSLVVAPKQDRMATVRGQSALAEPWTIG
jgi:hypothetical protein